MSVNKFIIKINPADLVPKSGARIYYYAALWITLLQAGAIILLWSKLPRVVPLFFTEPWGEARLAPKLFLTLLPVLSLVSIAVNLIMGKGAKGESQLLSYSLAVSAAAISVMFTISLFGILQSLL